MNPLVWNFLSMDDDLADTVDIKRILALWLILYLGCPVERPES